MMAVPERLLVPCCAMRLYFSDRAQELLALPHVVAQGLFTVNILARLAAPDGLQRMPEIRRGDGDGVNGFVFQQLAQVDERGGFFTPISSSSRQALGA